MAVYRVKVLGVQGINNKIFVANEIVTDAHFPEGNAAILAKEGKLEEIAEKKAEKVVKAKKETDEPAAS